MNIVDRSKNRVFFLLLNAFALAFPLFRRLYAVDIRWCERSWVCVCLHMCLNFVSDECFSIVVCDHDPSAFFRFIRNRNRKHTNTAPNTNLFIEWSPKYYNFFFVSFFFSHRRCFNFAWKPQFVFVFNLMILWKRVLHSSVMRINWPKKNMNQCRWTCIQKHTQTIIHTF